MARIGYGETYGWVLGLVTIVVGGFFVYKSVAKVPVLRAEAPAEFLDEKSTWPEKHRQAEERLGRAYWEAARRLSRSQYHFGDRLPDNPPGAFSVDAKAYPSLLESASSARARYWRNLHEVWHNPNVWETTYEWHTGWLKGFNY